MAWEYPINEKIWGKNNIKYLFPYPAAQKLLLEYLTLFNFFIAFVKIFLKYNETILPTLLENRAIMMWKMTTHTMTMNNRPTILLGIYLSVSLFTAAMNVQIMFLFYIW